jgi:hypothetical protein
VREVHATGCGSGLCGVWTSKNRQKRKFAEFLFSDVG